MRKKLRRRKTMNIRNKCITIIIIDSFIPFCSVAFDLFIAAAVNHSSWFWATLNFTRSLFFLLFPDRTQHSQASRGGKKFSIHRVKGDMSPERRWVVRGGSKVFRTGASLACRCVSGLKEGAAVPAAGFWESPAG